MTSLQTTGRPERHRGKGWHTYSPPGMEGPPLEGALGRAISEAAYYRAEARGFEPGHELEDWIEAERQIATTN